MTSGPHRTTPAALLASESDRGLAVRGPVTGSLVSPDQVRPGPGSGSARCATTAASQEPDTEGTGGCHTDITECQQYPQVSGDTLDTGLLTRGVDNLRQPSGEGRVSHRKIVFQ